MKLNNVQVYTDGSCNTKLKIGAWAALILIDEEQIVLQNIELETTNNRMELQAVISAINYINEKFDVDKIDIFTDSQYVTNILIRKDKLSTSDFITKKGNILNNSDLLKQLILQIETNNIQFIKVKAHQKIGNGTDYNIFVDKLSRKLARDYIEKNNF